MFARFESNQSALLGIATLALCLGLAAPAPANIEVESPTTVVGAGERRIELLFRQAADTSVVGYKIYARGSDGTELAGGEIPLGSSLISTSYLLVENDASYSVWMTSFNSSGTESPPSRISFVPQASGSESSPPPPPPPPASDPPPPASDPEPTEDDPEPPPPPTEAMDPTLQHWWRLGLLASRPGHDYGNSHISVDLGATSSGITSSDIKFDSDGSYIDFNGLDEQMRSQQSQLDVADVWSLAIWLRPEQLDESSVVFEAASATGSMNNTIRIELAGSWSGDPLRLTITDRFGTTTKDRLYNAGLQSGSWVHVVVVYDRGVFKLYADGELAPVTVSGLNKPGTMTDTSRMVSVGSAVLGASPYAGEVQSVAMWDIALTDQDVEDIYDGGDKGFNLNQ